MGGIGVFVNPTAPHADFVRATVIFVFLVPSQLAALAPALRVRLAAGARVVSQRFEIPGLRVTAHIGAGTAVVVDSDTYFDSLGAAFLYEGADSLGSPK